MTLEGLKPLPSFLVGSSDLEVQARVTCPKLAPAPEALLECSLVSLLTF